MTGPGPADASGPAADGSAFPGPAGDAGGCSVVGVGVDAVDVDRFRTALGRRPALAERLFTDGERAYAAAARDPAERLAARFAAKEAVMKALGSGLGSFPLRDVEVVRTAGSGAASGVPSLRLGPAAARLARRRGVARWHLSLTHTGQVAVAMVVAEGRA